MENTISTQSVKNLSALEIIHYTLLWCYNWTQEDFKIAFKDSPLGWDYFWNKLQGKCQGENPTDATSAIVGIVLNMDNKHQQMLFEFIFNSRYSENIIKQRETNSWFKQQIELSKKKNEH